MPPPSGRRPNNDTVIRRVNSALDLLLLHDGELIERDANERTISAKLAGYLQAKFFGWNVDCEYNRLGDLTKTLPAYRGRIRAGGPDAVSVYPDIIVHKRGRPDNLLVIEIKKSTNAAGYSRDLAKLSCFTSADYNYQLGLFLSFDVQGRRVGIKKWFREGVQFG